MSLREDNLSFLEEKTFDILIVGGGINGAVSASALSIQGLSVALIEKEDFASSTSQESSNLIWGGIKYLQNLEISLVRKLCKSRNELLRAFPENIKEIRFLAMIEKKFKFHPILLYIGSIFYWILGNFFTQAPRYFHLKKLKKREKYLNTAISNGGFEYSDALLVDNDARFVFQFIRRTIDYGGIVANYVEAKGSKRENNLWVHSVKDLIHQREFQIFSKCTINACGPNLDIYNELCKQNTDYEHLFSKGIHLLVPSIHTEKRIITFFSDDERPFFIIPMENRSCLGTTDTFVEKIPAKVTDEDRDFILNNVNKRLQLNKQIHKDDIIAERCGVRPLVVKKRAKSKKKQDWIALSRKHIMEVDFEKKHISIYGGKLSDCINIGKEVIDFVQKFGVNFRNKNSGWYGEDSQKSKKLFFTQANSLNIDRNHCKGKKEKVSIRLWRRYGNKALSILEMIRKDPKMEEQVMEDIDYLRAEIEYMASSEMIVKLADFFRRRTSLALVERKEDLHHNKGLLELSRILFGSEQAENKIKEYFLES